MMEAVIFDILARDSWKGLEFYAIGTIGIRSTELDLDDILTNEQGYHRLQFNFAEVMGVPIVSARDELFRLSGEYSKQYLLYCEETDQTPALFVGIIELTEDYTKQQAEHWVAVDLELNYRYKKTIVVVAGMDKEKTSLQFEEWLEKLGVIQNYTPTVMDEALVLRRIVSRALNTYNGMETDVSMYEKMI